MGSDPLDVFSKQDLVSHTGFYGSIKLREKLKFANVCRNFSHVRSLWGQKVAAKVFKLLLSTLIARWEAKVCELLPRFATAKVATNVERRDFSQSRQAPAPTHARRPSAATHTREIPATDERPSQNTLTTRWIACDGPAV